MFLVSANVFLSETVIKAFIAIALISLTLPFLGLKMITRRLSNIGDTLAHTSLLGIAIGLASGTLPIYWALIVSVICGVVIELVRTKLSKYAEITLVIVMSFSVALVGLLSKYIKSGTSLESYLFGSLYLVKWTDIYLLIPICFLVVLFSILFYRSYLYISYSEDDAKISNIKVKSLNILLIVFTSLVVAVSSSIVGSLIISSLLIIPSVVSLQLFKSYKFIQIGSVVISCLASIFGLIVAVCFSLAVGPTIVLVNLVVLILVLILKRSLLYFDKKKIRNKEKESKEK